MWPTRRLLLALLPTAFLPFQADLARAGTAPLDPECLEDARTGLEHLYHARIEEAREAFERIRTRHPESPAADFLLGGIEWHRVTTGPGGFVEGGAAEKSFLERMDAAIDTGEAAVESDPGDVAARFFLGGAYGYKARYLALQEKYWSAYRTGRRGVSHLERVVREDPELEDAYLGLGIYHYYADVLPAALRMLGTFVGVRGDRGRGLAEIRRALTGGVLVREECRFFLAELHTSFEEDHWTALGYAAGLRHDYPENELFTWLHARVLDELHLADLSLPEWSLLRSSAQGRSLQGFVDYRLARAAIFGGDFEGGAAQLARGLAAPGGFGSRRITMWAHLRRGLCLDFLGRHQQALESYRMAAEVDASDHAKRRAAARLAAGKSDASILSLEELAETARILKGARRHPEPTLRRVENQVTRPSRGLSRSERVLFFEILQDLAMARLVRGDPEGCEAAIGRAQNTWQDLPKSSRADLEALRARARWRSGRRAGAVAELGRAYAGATGAARERIGRERDLLERLSAEAPVPAPPDTGIAMEFIAPDRGEFLLEVEGSFLPEGVRLPLAREGNVWKLRWQVEEADSVLYRFVVDGIHLRVDPRADRVLLLGDESWGVLRLSGR